MARLRQQQRQSSQQSGGAEPTGAELQQGPAGKGRGEMRACAALRCASLSLLFFGLSPWRPNSNHKDKSYKRGKKGHPQRPLKQGENKIMYNPRMSVTLVHSNSRPGTNKRDNHDVQAPSQRLASTHSSKKLAS